VARTKTETKPVLDAVNDAVSALSDLVRSLRGKRSRGTDIKSKATAAARQVKQGARDAKSDVSRAGAEVRRAGHHLKTRFERAWQALTTANGVNAGAKSGASRKKGAKSSSRRKPARARA
jgi:hypothetical protein